MIVMLGGNGDMHGSKVDGEAVRKQQRLRGSTSTVEVEKKWVRQARW